MQISDYRVWTETRKDEERICKVTERLGLSIIIIIIIFIIIIMYSYTVTFFLIISLQ